MSADSGNALNQTLRKLIIAILSAIAMAVFSRLFLAAFHHQVLIGIITFLVTLWTNNGLPMGIVSLLPLILFPAFGILDLPTTASNYANPVIFLFLGGFMLAIAVQKTALHQFVVRMVLPNYVQTPGRIIFALGLIAASLSSLLSNTTTALLLLPIALYLTQQPSYQARFVLAVAYGSSIGGIVTPIGTPPNLILMGFLESQGLTAPIFGQWFIMMVPLAGIMLIAMPWLLLLGSSTDQYEGLSLTESRSRMNTQQRILAILLTLLVLLLFLNSPIKPFYAGLGLDEKLIMLGAGLLMFFPGLQYLKWEDTKAIPYEIIFLFGAGFSIANGFMSTGLANELAVYLVQWTEWPFLILMLVLAIIVTFCTEVTSNTALVSLMLPIIYSIAQDMQLNDTYSLLILIVVTICGSYAFMLPIATPPNAIAMSSGAVTTKTMVGLGLIFNILGIVLITFFASFIWNLMI